MKKEIKRKSIGKSHTQKKKKKKGTIVDGWIHVFKEAIELPFVGVSEWSTREKGSTKVCMIRGLCCRTIQTATVQEK
jgi:hypothetical protein